MKKHWSDEGYRLLTRIRQEDSRRPANRPQPRRGVSRSEHRRRLIQKRKSEAHKLKELWFEAPDNFSVIDNPDEMIGFFSEVSKAPARGYIPTLDMRRVKSLTPDAVAVLINVAKTIKRNYFAGLRGTEPESKRVVNVLRRSGFYEFISPPAGSGYILADRGIVAHENQRVVDTATAARLIRFATKALYGTPRDDWAIYAALGEFMHNTFDHASRRRTGRERWWVSVYYDEEQRVAHFTFVDTGVGIFGSRPVRTFSEAIRKFIGSDPEILRNIFEGKLGSATGIPWRGQGLPRVLRHVRNGRLANLTVITNRVKGVLDGMRFSQLGVEFRGTLYHWELR